MLYADEDRVSAEGRRAEPFFKPDWSPDLFLSWMYTGRPGVYRTTPVRQMGGFRPEFGPACEYDLALRLTAGPARGPCPRRALPPRGAARSGGGRGGAGGAPQSAGSHGARRRRGERPAPRPAPRPLHRPWRSHRQHHHRERLPAGAHRGEERTFYLLKCLESIARSSWRDLELIVLHGPRVPTEVSRRLALDGRRLRRVCDAVQLGAGDEPRRLPARGEHLLFLNDDVEVITPDWLERLLEFSQQAEIGAVGAKLFFPGGHLQHAGVAVLGGRPAHPFYAHRGDHAGHFNSLLVPRNCSAVTGACLMTRADVFRSMGGFDEGFPLNYNDVDYCLRLIAGGRRVVCTPHARLYHHELGTRSAGVRPEEADAFRRRWVRLGRRTRSTTPTCPSITWTAASARPAPDRSDPPDEQRLLRGRR